MSKWHRQPRVKWRSVTVETVTTYEVPKSIDETLRRMMSLTRSTPEHLYQNPFMKEIYIKKLSVKPRR